MSTETTTTAPASHNRPRARKKTGRMETGETRLEYLRRALRYCRAVYNRLRETPEFRYCHCSHPACQALKETETRFEDLGTFGIEGFIFDRDNPRGGGLSYLNTGETYELTLCFNSDSARFLISSWGDIAERLPER